MRNYFFMSFGEWLRADESQALLAFLLDPANDNGRGLYRRTGLFLQLGLLTASRPGEIAHLTADDIDWDNRLLRIEGTKTRFESTAGIRHFWSLINCKAAGAALIRTFHRSEYLET